MLCLPRVCLRDVTCAARWLPPRRRAPHVPQIIDVRTQGEFVAGHIAGARNASFLPPWDFPNRSAEALGGHLGGPAFAAAGNG